MTWSSGDLFETFVTSLLVEKEINHYLSKQAVRLGLSLQEFQVLWIVANSEELVLTELAMITTQSKDELQGVVTSLEADGLIFGTCNGISRKRVYRVTQEGRALIEQTPVYGGANYSCHEFDPEIIWT